MQTTLLGLAIALILALVTALVGPLLVDWGTYRALFEREASRIVGAEVRVTGPIEARLLPSPRLTLADVAIGTGEGAAQVQSFEVELGLGPLMRGEWRATELRVGGPTVRLVLDSAGHWQGLALQPSLGPDALVVERLSVEGGTVILSEGGAEKRFDAVWFNGEARSLAGPFKGEGAATYGGELYPYRLSLGRLADDNTARLHLNVDPVNQPMTIELDGTANLTATPRFEGTLGLSRPVGIGLRGTRSEGQGVTQPWRVSAKVKASAQSALFESFEFLYGSEESGARLTGVADFTFGRNPAFNGVLSGRQLDLDRVFVAGNGTRLPPAAALRELAALGSGAFKPTFPVRIGIGIDQITLGGSTVQGVQGDIGSNSGGWDLDRFEFRAPGFARVRLGGRLAVDERSVSFTGPVEVDANDPKVFAAWLEGRGDIGQGDMRALRLRGDITLASDRVGIEGLNIEFDRKTLGGRLAYRFAQGATPSALDMTVNAPEFDIDTALSFGNALLAGSRFERPRYMTIAADIGRATLSGFSANNVSARVKVDGEGLQIDRLAISNFNGGAFSASGRLVTGTAPQGSMRLDLDAPDVRPVVALLARFAPESAAVLESRATAMAPAKLHGQFSLAGDAPGTQGKLTLDGSLGKVRIVFNGQGRVDTAALSFGDIALDGKAESDDGKDLIAMLGLSRVVAVEAGRGGLTLKAAGVASGDLRVEAQVMAGGLSASLDGSARPFVTTPSAAVTLRVTRADLAPLRTAGRAPLPVTYSGRVSINGADVTLSDNTATVAGAGLRGKIALRIGQPSRITGDIDADSIEAPALIAALIGMPPAPAPKGAWSWSNEPFEKSILDAVDGQITLKAARVAVLPSLVARELNTTIRLGDKGARFEDLKSELAGGRLSGNLAFQDSGNGMRAKVKLALADVDAAALVGGGPRPALGGRLTGDIDVEGGGLSPVALIGSLRGSGKVALSDAQFAGYNPISFETVTRAVDQGLVIDGYRIGEVARRALDTGDFTARRAEGELAISAGQVRLARINAEGNASSLSVAGTLDLTDGSLDGRLVLSGAQTAGGARPDIFTALRGPVTAPNRSIDVSALTGWLTLRSVERQTNKLRAIEGDTRASPAEGQPMPPPIAPRAPSVNTQN